MTTEAQQFPGVDRAYDFVVPSYSWSLERLAAADKRLQDILTYSAAATFAAPAIVKTLAPAAELVTAWFVVGLAIFVGIGILGSAVRIWGMVNLVTPAILYDQWLGKDEWTFKKDMVFFAGEAMRRNRTIINRRGYTADLLSVAFAFEVLCFVLGIAESL